MQAEISGRPITRVSFDGAVTLLAGSEHQIRIETSATIGAPGRPDITFDPEDPSQAASEIVKLVGSQIAGVEISHTGLLTVQFGTG